MTRTTHTVLAVAALCHVSTGCNGSQAPVLPEARIAGPSAELSVPRGDNTAGQNADPLRYSDSLHPTAAIETSYGRIVVRLDAENAPMTVRNFLRYVNAGHYDNTLVHYVRPDEMILGGGFTADYRDKPTSEPVRSEAHNGRKNKRGTMAMSRAFESIDSATSHFFINLADNPSLDYRGQSSENYGYCVFGDVIEGLDVSDRLARAATHDRGRFPSTPIEPLVIESIRQLP